MHKRIKQHVYTAYTLCLYILSFRNSMNHGKHKDTENKGLGSMSLFRRRPWPRAYTRILASGRGVNEEFLRRLLETRTRNAVVSSSSRQSPLSLTKTHMKQHIAPNARAHECLLFGAPPAKIYIDNIASAAGASGENFEVLGANSPKNRCFCDEISKMKLPPKRDSPPIRV